MLDSISEDTGSSQITKIISLSKNDAEKAELKKRNILLRQVYAKDSMIRILYYFTN